MPKSWWVLGLSELVGTALLLAVGGSFVVVDFASTGPIVHLISNDGARRAITGFLFGTTGGLIALSPVGKISGAHINPVVTLAFWIQKKLSAGLVLVYMGGQFAGAVIGSAALLVWGPWARSTHESATVPGPAGAGVAVGGEFIATMCLITGLFVCLGNSRLRRYTPALFPLLYAVLVWWEAPLSGSSTNPARTFGPDLVAHVWAGWWVYLVGPVLGTIVALFLLNRLVPWLVREIEVAKLYHFGHDPYSVFHSQVDADTDASA